MVTPVAIINTGICAYLVMKEVVIATSFLIWIGHILRILGSETAFSSMGQAS